MGPLCRLLRDCSFFHCPYLHWFLQPEVMRLYFPSTGTLGCTVWPVAGISHSSVVHPGFYPLRVNVVPLGHLCVQLISYPWVIMEPIHAFIYPFIYSSILNVHLICIMISLKKCSNVFPSEDTFKFK